MDNFNNGYMPDEEARRRQLQRERQRRLEQRRRDRQQAIAFLIIVGLVIMGTIIFFISKAFGNKNDDSSSAESKTEVTQSSSESEKNPEKQTNNGAETDAEHKIEVIDGITYVDGILVANKSYNLPEDYDPGLNDEAFAAFEKMIAGASKDGISIYLCSGYRNYQDQQFQYNEYVTNRGVEEADKISARPGHSEHQTGLAFDVNYTEFSFADTEEGKWLAEHCSEYGFIIRYPENKEDKTGFSYEPWHVRYLGVDLAKKVTESGLCLEEYLGITSEYNE